MAYTPEQVVSYGFPFDDFDFTYNLAAGITQANSGQAVTLDVTGASTFKLAGNAADVQGILRQVEDRDVSGMLVGTVSRKFKSKIKAVPAHGLAVGDYVVGSTTPGLVRKALVDGSEPNTVQVVEILTDDYVAVERF